MSAFERVMVCGWHALVIISKHPNKGVEKMGQGTQPLLNTSSITQCASCSLSAKLRLQGAVSPK